ncbi:MAG: DNA-binding protein WhiA [Ruminococcaceae bacterium]|nr:DNA-binding protein WhiA [Oscillospiraceae bacterium]
MSFASDTKQELCREPVHRRCCAVAESYGVLLFCNTFSDKLIRIVTESRDFAQRLPGLFKKAFSVSFDDLPDVEQGGKLIFQIHDRAAIARIYEAFGLTAENNLALHINLGVLEEECDRISFLRGAFLAGGSVTDPEKRYHLELTTSHLKVSNEAYSLLLEQSFQPKDTMRNGSSVLYFKQSDAIEDFLTLIGAPVCAMRIMEAKVEKDLRNGVNRRVNCETANLGKAVDAAQEQIAAIRQLHTAGVLEQLPEKLQKTAQLRVEHPEATLTELAQLHEPILTKSAVNHRLRKLMEAAKE